jgi:hypothetical protein
MGLSVTGSPGLRSASTAAYGCSVDAQNRSFLCVTPHIQRSPYRLRHPIWTAEASPIDGSQFCNLTLKGLTGIRTGSAAKPDVASLTTEHDSQCKKPG